MHLNVDISSSNWVIYIVRVENTEFYGWNGARVLLQVGCQVGGAYGCNLQLMGS
jgi:hypothetical protein